jgi:hypothetical protein
VQSHISSQRGEHIDAALADGWVALAQHIIDPGECRPGGGPSRAVAGGEEKSAGREGERAVFS